MLAQKRIIIGIDGYGGSGKTTFAKSLAEKWQKEGKKTLILHLDHYITNRATRYNTGFPQWHEYYYFQWNVEWIETLLHRLSFCTDEKEMIVAKYDVSSDTYSEEHLQMADVIIVEGVFLQREKWRHFFDYVYFIACDKRTRLERVCGRDTYLGTRDVIFQRYEERYLPAEDYYQENVQPEKIADEVVRNC